MITDLKTFCRLFYNTTAIPIHYYHIADRSKCSFPSLLEDTSVFRGHLLEPEHFTKNPDYYVSPSFSYFGFVKSSSREEMVLVGPVFSTPSSASFVRNFMREWAIDPENRPQIEDFLANVPTLSFNRFLHVLAYLFFCLNGQELDINEHFHLEDTRVIENLSPLHAERVYEAKEYGNYHNTWQFERQLIRLVQNGSLEELKELLRNSTNLTAGTMADNALRQEKNILISSVSSVTRAAIDGGMDMEQAYQLSDVYIRECERSQSISEVANLQYALLIDFTERVAQNKVPKGMSREIFDAIQFITHHINDPLQVGDVVAHIGKSRSYLIRQFKKELGFDISSFIQRCKLEEAKSLLTYSDKSLGEISNYLCFSSQSYFQNVFKKKYGLTPKQYREREQRKR